MELIQEFKESLAAGLEKVACEYDKEELVEKTAEELERLMLTTGMDKEASWGSSFAGAFGGENVGKAALGMGATALGTLGAMAFSKAVSTMGASGSKQRYQAALQQAIKMSEILADNPMKAKRLGDSIFAFAPTVAGDANVLANVLTNAVHGESLDLQTVRAVTELEEKLAKQNR